MKGVNKIFLAVLKLGILLSITKNCVAQNEEDEKLSKEILKLGDQFYFNCLRYAAFINEALAKNQSVDNVPKRDIRDEDVIFWLYTRQNAKVPQNLSAANPNTLKNSNFNPSKLTVFVIPGATDPAKDYAEQVPSKVLPSIDVNVIITNYDSYSFYNATYVVNRTVPQLAKICIKLINQFIKAGSTAKQMYLIGFSAGGQTAGFIGRGIKNIGRILGLDPGAPCYTYQPKSMRLTGDNALSVKVTHCSGGVLGPPPNSTVGADIFFYGGIFQPFCRNISSPLQTGLVATFLCKYYFFDSLTNFNMSFGIKCDSYDDYKTEIAILKHLKSLDFIHQRRYMDHTSLKNILIKLHAL